MARQGINSQAGYPAPVLGALAFISHILTQLLFQLEQQLATLPQLGLLGELATLIDISIKLPLFLILSTPPFIFNLVIALVKLNLLLLVDAGLTITNIFLPRLKGPPAGHPTSGPTGKYPAPQAVTSDCSRGPCPALNALSNHGILAHNGKHIDLDEMGDAIRKTFNCAPTFVKFAVEAMRKQFGRDWINLSDLGAHNIIEHDASLLRHDTYFVPNQATPAPDLVAGLLNPTRRARPDILSIYDIARFSSLRRAQSVATNPHTAPQLSAKHALFSSNNNALLLVIWGGNVQAIKKFLETETFEDGWLPAPRSYWGATFLEFNLISARLELSTQLDEIVLPSQLNSLSTPKFKDIKWGNIGFNQATERGVPVFGVLGG